MLETRVLHEPVVNGAATVAGQVVGDEVEVTLRIDLVEPLQEREVASSVRLGRSTGRYS
jgi:hypothetical protein